MAPPVPLTREQLAGLRQWFLPERPGPLIAQHLIGTGNGSCLADRWPDPRALVVETGGNYTVPAASASVSADGRPRTVLSHLVPAGSPFGQPGPLGRCWPCPLSSRTRRSLGRRPGYGP
jgi:hypothetical protein